MALMMGKLHDALVAAGIDKQMAREAAEEAANFENRLAKVEADLTLLKWMVGFNLVVTLGILWRVVTL
jgi:hypothetical protein